MRLGKKKRDKAPRSGDSNAAPSTGTEMAGASKPQESVRDADFDQGDVPEKQQGSSLEVAEMAADAQRLAELQQQIDGLKQEVEEFKDKYLRALAELENYKKRALRERSDYLKYQGEPILYDLLDVIDNFERALEHQDADPGKLKAGLELIYKQFCDVLSKWEVRGESAVGREFNPAAHSALSRVAVDDATPGTVINELKKAYFYKDKLLRAAQVVVATDKTIEKDLGGSSKDKSGGNAPDAAGETQE